MMQNVSAYASQNRSPDDTMTATSDDDEIGVVVMRSFHDGFSWMSLKPFKFVIYLKIFQGSYKVTQSKLIFPHSSISMHQKGFPTKCQIETWITIAR